MELNVAQPNALASKPGSQPQAKDDLKTLPLAEVEKKLRSSPDGLTASRGTETAHQYGPNEIEEKKTNAFLKFLSYFWGPIPWMIEAAVILSAVARHWPISPSSSFCFWPTPWSDSGKSTRRATPSPH